MLRRDALLAMAAAGLKLAAEEKPVVSSATVSKTPPVRATGPGIPGPFPGRVVAIHHEGSIVSGAYQAAPVREMMRKGMAELTGAPSWEDAWRLFFKPGDVVGIKVNPVGRPHVISAPAVLHEIVEGLKAAGVRTPDIFVYDRYRNEFLEAGYDKWLPDGVRWSWATYQSGGGQLDMEGYDRDHYVELPLVHSEFNPAEARVRRSFFAKFLTQTVNKLVNLAVLKTHQSAGVTLALKNLSHGLVNNTRRSHSTGTMNACGVFIPAVVDQPIIREKAVLQIVDGIRGLYRGGPVIPAPDYVWENKTIYFATDPVALDRTAWQAIDAYRADRRLPPIAISKPPTDGIYLNCQPEYIEIAGALGLGEFDTGKITVKRSDI